MKEKTRHIEENRPAKYWQRNNGEEKLKGIQSNKKKTNRKRRLQKGI